MRRPHRDSGVCLLPKGDDGKDRYVNEGRASAGEVTDKKSRKCYGNIDMWKRRWKIICIL